MDFLEHILLVVHVLRLCEEGEGEGGDEERERLEKERGLGRGREETRGDRKDREGEEREKETRRTLYIIARVPQIGHPTFGALLYRGGDFEAQRV